MQRISSHLKEHSTANYLINLDPAVLDTPYEPNIDIRDTVSLLRQRQCACAELHSSSALSLARARTGASQVNYKNVMKQYNLGPNGGILTALNLFATRFDQARASAPHSRLQRHPVPSTSLHAMLLHAVLCMGSVLDCALLRKGQCSSRY